MGSQQGPLSGLAPGLRGHHRPARLQGLTGRRWPRAKAGREVRGPGNAPFRNKVFRELKHKVLAPTRCPGSPGLQRWPSEL